MTRYEYVSGELILHVVCLLTCPSVRSFIFPMQHQAVMKKAETNNQDAIQSVNTSRFDIGLDCFTAPTHKLGKTCIRGRCSNLIQVFIVWYFNRSGSRFDIGLHYLVNVCQSCEQA